MTDPTDMEWYNAHHLEKETDEFNEWWFSSYGPIEQYADKDTYYVRKAFALMGWIARGEIEND